MTFDEALALYNKCMYGIIEDKFKKNLEINMIETDKALREFVKSIPSIDLCNNKINLLNMDK